MLQKTLINKQTNKQTKKKKELRLLRLKISNQLRMEKIHQGNESFYNTSDVINLAEVDKNKISIVKEDSGNSQLFFMAENHY